MAPGAVGAACWWLDALYERLCANVFASDHLFADDTPVPVLDPGRGRTKTGRLWVYARDQRPWGGPAAPAAIFVFAPDRKSERPAAHLENFSGILHVDGYAGFARLQARGDVTLAACWVHMRRNFYEFFEATNSPIAAEALRRISELYGIEERIRGQSPALRLAERRTFSKPLVEKLKVWMEQQLTRVPPRGKLADAIRYALTRWHGLTRFLHDGCVELDTNPVERAIRPVAIRESLCIPSSNVCKHWNRAVVGGATRASLTRHRGFDHLRRQVVGADLMRCSANNLLGSKDAIFDQAPNRVVCGAERLRRFRHG